MALVTRNVADVFVQPVLRVPGGENITESLVACDHCGVVPMGGSWLQLSLVGMPDRDQYIFLGPNCLSNEIARYIAGRPIE